MELVATYPNMEHASVAIDLLQKASILHEVRKGEENGLEIVEIHVAPEQFDKACDLVEQAEAMVQEAARQRARLRCPACNSTEFNRRDDIDCSTSVGQISHIIECKKCGQLIPR
jgi:hypothetical protein